MHLNLIVETADPGDVWNGFRLANTALAADDEVTVYFLGDGVEAPDAPAGDDVNPHGVMRKYLRDGGEIYACHRCLEHRDMEGDELRPPADMERLRSLIERADETVTIG